MFPKTLLSRPVLFTFLASLALSIIAQYGNILNRDGMLYVTTAEAYLEGGFSSARALFSWPFLPILMAWTNKITGLSLETSAHTLNALFMAGACALLVDCSRRKHIESAWWVALAVLAIPGINEYRNELLREYGCWFFVMLAFWLALRWTERPTWAMTFAVQGTLGIAALFRPEALALFPALLIWQAIEAPSGQRVRRITILCGLPALCGAILLILFVTDQLPSTHRLAGELNRLSFERFDAKAKIVSQALIEYARHNAGEILFFGSLALIPIKLIQKTGLFLLPVIYLFAAHQARPAAQTHRLFACAGFVTLLILAVFVTDLHFLAGRYVGLTLLFSSPFIGFSLWALTKKHNRLRLPIVGVATVLMLANVVSTGQSKSHHLDAGRWLRENVEESSQIYIDGGRTAFHAGWRTSQLRTRNDRAGIEKALRENTYTLYVLEVSRKDAPIAPWLSTVPLNVIQQYSQPTGDAVIIARPNATSPRN